MWDFLWVKFDLCIYVVVLGFGVRGFRRYVACLFFVCFAHACVLGVLLCFVCLLGWMGVLGLI